MRQIEVLVRAIKDYDSYVIVAFHLQTQRVSFFGCLRIDQLNRRVIEGRTLVTGAAHFDSNFVACHVNHLTFMESRII